MSKDNRDSRTEDDLRALLQKTAIDFRERLREATEFKPGELTPEEEELV